MLKASFNIALKKKYQFSLCSVQGQVNNELQRSYNEATLAGFEVLFPHLAGDTEETHGKPQSG
jgi:hypothetical protein